MYKQVGSHPPTLCHDNVLIRRYVNYVCMHVYMQVHVILCTSDEGSLLSWDSDHEHLFKLRVIQCIHSTGECFLGFIPVWQKKNHNSCQVFSRAALGWAVLNFFVQFCLSFTSLYSAVKGSVHLWEAF